MSKSGEKDHEVGYGRPPRHSQFKKGKSGNPKGRRKRAKSLIDLFLKALDEKVTINENGSRRKISKRDALAKQLVNKAVSGDNISTKLVLDIIGPLSEHRRQAELEASHRGGADAHERLTKKLAQMSERLRAGLPLFPDETGEPETSDDTGDPQRS